MAIIVDKVQKRKDIALSCKEIFFQNGINDLTISQIAKTAGVGKGTIYEYFKNKEDIIFEIVNILIQERNLVIEKEIASLKNTKDKVKEFSKFFYSDDDHDIELRQLYKEFISISLVNPDNEMTEFQTSCTELYFGWFKSIIYEGVEKGELIPEAKSLAMGLFSTAEGIFIKATVTNMVENVEEEINTFTDALFNLIEVKR